MSSIDTSHFREELERHRERLLATIAHHDIGGSTLVEESGDLQPSSWDNHPADLASETYDRELDEGLEEDARARLREIDEALQRIESGEYGKCRACGKQIPPERLEVLPWTTLCIEDARKLER